MSLSKKIECFLRKISDFVIFFCLLTLFISHPAVMICFFIFNDFEDTFKSCVFLTGFILIYIIVLTATKLFIINPLSRLNSCNYCRKCGHLEKEEIENHEECEYYPGEDPSAEPGTSEHYYFYRVTTWVCLNCGKKRRTSKSIPRPR